MRCISRTGDQTQPAGFPYRHACNHPARLGRLTVALLGFPVRFGVLRSIPDDDNDEAPVVRVGCVLPCQTIHFGRYFGLSPDRQAQQRQQQQGEGEAFHGRKRGWSVPKGDYGRGYFSMTYVSSAPGLRHRSRWGSCLLVSSKILSETSIRTSSAVHSDCQ